jgi:hypothetical protein
MEKPGPSSRAFFLLLPLFCAGVFAAVWHFQDAQLDDAFITYRFARNLAAGLGFVYNPPVEVFGTTTPLYTLLLASTGRLGLDIPATSLFFNALSICLLAVTVYFSARPADGPWRALLAALMIAVLPGTYTVLGMETLTYTALIYAGLHLVERHNFTAAALMAAAAVLTRYDGMLLAGVVLWREWSLRGSPPWRSGTLFSAMLLPWLVYATVTFGSPLPGPLYAKTGFGGNVFLGDFGRSVFGLVFSASAPVWMHALLWLFLGGAVALALVASQRATLRGVGAWMSLYVVGFGLLGLLYTHHWYYYPLLPGMLLVGANAFGSIATVVDRRVPDRRLSWLLKRSLLAVVALPMVLVTLLGLAGLWTRFQSIPEIGGRYRVYRSAALWVCANHEVENGIAIPEIGIFGWFCDQKIIDPYGLVTPEMIPYIRADDRAGGLSALRPDLLIIQNYPLEGAAVFPHAALFSDPYHLVRLVEDPEFPYRVAIFARGPP